MDVSNPIYFNRESDNYQLFKRIILEQGELKCRNYLDREYIMSCLEKFTDGYIFLANMNISGKTIRSKADRYFLKSFCLFKNNDKYSEVKGLITCGDRNYPGSGLRVLQAVGAYIKEFKIRTWNIYSLPYQLLINYYKELGFKEVMTRYNKNGKKKVIVMTQEFTYDEDINEICDEEICDLHLEGK